MLERVDGDDWRDRAERLLGGDERVGRDAVEDRRLPVEIGGEARGALTAVHRLRAALERVGDVLVHLRRHAFVVEGAHRRRLREGVTEEDTLHDEPRELRDELLAHVAVDEQALAGRAALAGAEEAGGHGRLGCEVEVGVVEDDDRAVAAELEHRRLAGGRLGHAPPGLGRADEADPVRARVARDLVADDRARPGDEVEDPRRQVGLDHALCEGDAGDGGGRRGRPHHGVSAGECGGDQLGRHRVRPVPGRDHADDPARSAQEEDTLARGGRVGEAPLEPLRVLGGAAPVLDELLDLVARLG